MTGLLEVVVGNALGILLASTTLTLMGSTLSVVLMLRRHDRTLYGDGEDDDGLVDDVDEHRRALREEDIL